MRMLRVAEVDCLVHGSQLVKVESILNPGFPDPVECSFHFACPFKSFSDQNPPRK